MQLELPWALGPPDGRYVVRDAASQTTTHVLLLATLGAVERRLLRAGRRGRALAPEPDPAPVSTTRATVIEAAPASAEDAAAWLAAADWTTAEAALDPLARAVRAHRLASGDPHAHEPALAQALVVRAGYGAGEQVAVGRWTEARELQPAREGRRRRAVLHPQERLAALLGGRVHALACEELALRARRDLEAGQVREGALQARVALDAALVELPREAEGLGSAALSERIGSLAEDRTAVAAIADAALAGVLPPSAVQTLDDALGRLEAALRARAAAQSHPGLQP